MLIDLHGIIIACESPDEEMRERWAQSFSSRPQIVGRDADITFDLRLVSAVPPAPAEPPLFTQGDLLSVHLSPTSNLQPPTSNFQLPITIYFPRFGQLRINPAAQHVVGELVDAALTTYGVFEDVVAMGLTALLRRRHLFLIHAFAAAWDGRALLLVGDIGSGKTTTGISLLRAGWKLLSNDSPLLMADRRPPTADHVVMALAYPGLLSAYNDSLQRFTELAAVTPPVRSGGSGVGVRQKTTFAAESVYPDVWIESAPVGAIVFPQVARRAAHQVTRLSEPNALRRLLPNAIDRWDVALIPEHLQLLTTLVAQAPAYQIELGEQVETLPRLLEQFVLLKPTSRRASIPPDRA